MHSLAHIECVVVGNKGHSSSSRTMALRTTLAQLQAQPQGAPSALMRGLTRWKQSARARAADISTRPGEAPVADVARKTFRHWRNEETGHWQPPKYSQRRQAQLVRAAYKMGTEDSVVSSPKFARYARRMENMPTHEVLVGWPTVTWPTLSAEEDANEARRIARTYEAHGPYAGRSAARMFKGKKGERESYQRRQRVQEIMRTMDDTIAEWRKVCERDRVAFVIHLLTLYRKRQTRVPRRSPFRPCRVRNTHCRLSTSRYVRKRKSNTET